MNLTSQTPWIKKRLLNLIFLFFILITDKIGELFFTLLRILLPQYYLDGQKQTNNSKNSHQIICEFF